MNIYLHLFNIEMTRKYSVFPDTGGRTELRVEKTGMRVMLDSGSVAE